MKSWYFDVENSRRSLYPRKITRIDYPFGIPRPNRMNGLMSGPTLMFSTQSVHIRWKAIQSSLRRFLAWPSLDIVENKEPRNSSKTSTNAAVKMYLSYDSRLVKRVMSLCPTLYLLQCNVATTVLASRNNYLNVFSTRSPSSSWRERASTRFDALRKTSHWTFLFWNSLWLGE